MRKKNKKNQKEEEYVNNGDDGNDKKNYYLLKYKRVYNKTDFLFYFFIYLQLLTWLILIAFFIANCYFQRVNDDDGSLQTFFVYKLKQSICDLKGDFH